MNIKSDILAFAAHPDDAELSCSGTLLKYISLGKTVGIVDLTKGELGTRGTAEIRLKESQKATEIMGIHFRENLGFKDGLFIHDNEHMLEVVRMIRKYRPQIVLANAVNDRHPDHGRASALVSEACFYSGLNKIETLDDGIPQKSWRPQNLYFYIQDYLHKPDFIIDISDFFEKKMEAIKAFKSQFYDPASKEPETAISGEAFLEFIKSRAMDYGRYSSVKYAEGFMVQRVPEIKDLFSIR
jgi:bacillithiol biosynthesis deacetylase BshB1